MSEKKTLTGGGLTVGVIGLGRIGAQWSLTDKLRAKPATHVGAWLNMPAEVDKVIIADLDPTKATAIMGGIDDPHLFSASSNEFPLTECDIVSVATPAETHAEVVNKLLDADKPPALIFCEKPIATTVEDAKMMVDDCATKRVKLAVNHTRRWDPVWRFAADQILSDPKDTPNMAIGHFTGDLMNVGIHMADLVNWYKIGDCIEVFGHRDAEYLLFELEVFFQGRRVRVRGNGQAVETSTLIDSPRYDGVKELKLESTTDAVIQASAFPGAALFKSPMFQACKQLVRCVHGNEVPLCTGEDGLLALARTLSWEKKA